MTSFLLIAAKLILASGLLYTYYYFFLHNRGFHLFNRFYLLLAAVLPVVLAFVSIPLRLQPPIANGGGLAKTLQVIASGWGEAEAGGGAQSPQYWLTLPEAAGLLYMGGLAVGLYLLLQSLLYIARIGRKYPYERIGDTRFYTTTEPGTPFSFFRFIFWNQEIPFGTREGQQIFRHELYHVRQRHSSDLLLLELLCCIGWFNPFFYFIRKELKAVHEFLVDEYAVSQQDRLDYAELLVVHAINQKKAGLSHPFSQHHIKRRIMMITTSIPSRTRRGYFSRAMVLPLLLVLFSAFAVKLAKPPIAGAGKAGKPAIVIIDAGHGGIDPGAHSIDGLFEKDMTLALAQKINELAGQYNIQVVLTRNSDELPGNASDIKLGLMKRVEIATEKKADLFVSLHNNANGTNDIAFPGIEAYISARHTDNKAETLATTLLQQLGPVYNTSPVIKRRNEGGIWVLDKCPCPAVLLECGNISRQEDERFMNDKDNQEKMARGILAGIVKYLGEQR